MKKRESGLPLKFVIAIAVVALVLGIAVSSAYFKQAPASNQNISTNQNIPSTSQPTPSNTQTTLPPVYNLKVTIDVSSPSLGRGETALFSGQVTDLSFNPIGSAQVNASLLDFEGLPLNSKIFLAYPNGTYSGSLDIPVNLTVLGTYNISVQANLTNRFSQIAYTQVYVVR